MKAIKLMTLAVAATVAVSVLCSCSSSRIEKTRKHFISEGYEASEISEGDYPSFSAGAENALPRFSYIDCKENEVALDLFEKDKEIITEEAGENVESTDGENGVIFTGTAADGICYKVSAAESAVLFATYESGDSEKVDEIFDELGFN